MSNRFHNNPPLRYGMVDGWATSQIGDSHRAALRKDSYYELVAGALDIYAEREQILFGLLWSLYYARNGL